MEWVIGGIILLLILGVIFKPSRCDICNVNFKRKYYTWEIEGKKQHLCPNCNSKMDRKISSRKFKDRFG
ncbi:hypothetical protein [Photorhabdus heterorhabditis]|uniref:hypothetical protein n=1 Tax=Photorhabdus heterorhabditis TaxID=880156 RepID=UPI001BD5E6F1|nr:hypothetical protein [Photorhabdus heterorhabditis]MBS9441790.1 hypothetical protein [Photorhabdus heterorhabditis]